MSGRIIEGETEKDTVVRLRLSPKNNMVFRIKVRTNRIFMPYP